MIVSDFVKIFVERHAPRCGRRGVSKQERVAEFVADLTTLVQLLSAPASSVDLKPSDEDVQAQAAYVDPRAETKEKKRAYHRAWWLKRIAERKAQGLS